MADADENQAPPRAEKSRMLPVLLVLNTLLIGGVLFVLVSRPAAAPPGPEKAAAAGEAAKPALPAPGPMLKLDNFVIQIRSVEAERYVRLAFDLEVGDEADKSAVTAHIAHIRDAVISYFSDRTLDELRGSEGMERTKAALLKRLEDIVPGRRIRRIYVTDFIVQ